jgi:hypothetical protein
MSSSFLDKDINSREGTRVFFIFSMKISRPEDIIKKSEKPKAPNIKKCFKGVGQVDKDVDR